MLVFFSWNKLKCFYSIIKYNGCLLDYVINTNTLYLLLVLYFKVFHVAYLITINYWNITYGLLYSTAREIEIR